MPTLDDLAKLDELAKAGIAAINEKNFEEAVTKFAGALELAPDRPDMNNALGTAYLHKGEAPVAIPYLARAVELADDPQYEDPKYDPLRIEFHTSLALAYKLSDDIESAIDVLRKTVERWPVQVLPRMHLAQMLLASCRLDEGLEVYQALTTHEALDEERRSAAKAVIGAIRAFLEAEEPLQGSLFLEAHQASYQSYFDEIAKEQEGWYAEAMRMAKGADGELKPIIAEGSRPYAMSRADLVNPATGEMANVYSDTEPMIVAVQGLEPLAQVTVAMPWKGYAFEIWVSSACPWHWLPIIVQFAEPGIPEALIERLDPSIADWYLAGYNGDYGEKEWGRFHYITDPDVIGDRAVGYTVDLGRAKYECIEALIRRLVVLNDRHAIRRVLFGHGHLPAR